MYCIIKGIINNVFIIGDVLDVLKKVNLQKFHIIFLNKLFSTLENNGEGEEFLKIFCSQINNLPPYSFIVFNDINNRDRGRDTFDSEVSSLLKSVEKYYFKVDDETYNEGYTEIESKDNICTVPDDLSVSPNPTATKTVFFLYRKE